MGAKRVTKLDAMTRIIAGFAGSHRLTVPRNGTRPTSDRVREAIFSSLDARGVLPGARVLDLYAGSGALGLEAASRGARWVTLVERNRSAAQVAKANVRVVQKAFEQSSAGRGAGAGSYRPGIEREHEGGHEAGSEAGHEGGHEASLQLDVATQAVQTFLDATVGEFDIVFIDPPYEVDAEELVQNLEALAPKLAPHAVVVVERSARSPEPTWPVGLELERRKDYGETALWWLQRAGG